VATALEFLGGLLFVLGSDLGAKLLVLFLVPVTFIMHDFWSIKDTASQAYMIEMIMFWKNAALCGALLVYLSLKHDLRQAAIAGKLKAH
jgi:putative oxidoreductase